MNADEVLIEHHNVLRALLAQLAETGDVDLRHELLNRLTTELGIHTQIEDELFYPAVRAVSPMVWVAHSEHRQIDDQLGVVLRTDPASADFAVEVGALRHAVEHHAGHEEREMFPESAALGAAELERLGAALAARRAELGSSTLAQLRLRIKRETLRRL